MPFGQVPVRREDSRGPDGLAFFENSQCLSGGSQLGYDPTSTGLVAPGDGSWRRCGSADLAEWVRLLGEVQARSDAAGKLDWVVSIDSTTTRVQQHGATFPRDTGAAPFHDNPWWEPPDHAIGRSRGGLTCKVHLVAHGNGRPLGWVLTGGNLDDTTR